MNTWTIEPVVAPLFVAIIVVALVAIALVGPTFGKLSTNKSWVLKSLRLIAILVLTVGLLRPGCVTTVSTKQNASLLIFVDATLSMEHPHSATGPSRWDAMQSAFDENKEILQDLADEGITVNVFSITDTTERLEYVDGKIAWPQRPEGETTDMGSIEIGRQRFQDKRVLAYLLLGDGMQNAVNPDFELQQVMRSISDSQTPFYTVPFGKAVASDQFADLAIENMPDQFAMFVKNQLGVNATLSARGFAGRTIPVQLIVQDRSGKPTVVDTKQITVRKNLDQIPIQMTYVPQEPGPYRMTLRAEVQQNETAIRNNELPAFLTVYDGGLRVLYVEGEYRAERKFLKRAIDASPDIQMDVITLPETGKDSWPLNLVDRFSDPTYDVFILGDIDSRALYKRGIDANLNALVDAVNNGKGLIMLGGFHSFGPGGYRETPLADVLPVVMSRGFQDFDAPPEKQWHIERQIYLRTASPHFLTKLGNLENGKDAWESLPPLSGANRFGELKPTAQILIESRDGEPILVAQNVVGRVLAFAGDSTWRWWMHGHKDSHKRFWRQIVLWLAKRDGLNQDNVWIDLPQRRFESNSQIEFEIGAKDPDGNPVPGVEFNVKLIRPQNDRNQQDADEVPVQVFQQNGQIFGRIKREQVEFGGYYRIAVEGVKDQKSIGNTEVEFIVIENEKEKSNPAADPDLLGRLASYTTQWGGRSVAPEQFGELLEEIANRPLETKIEIPQRWRLADTFKDAMIYVTVFLAILTVEWVLRKKWGLV